jgi:hypothetical protein
MEQLKQIYKKFEKKRVNISFLIKNGKVLTFHNAFIISITDLSVIFEDNYTGNIKNFILSEITRCEEVSG